MTNTDFAAALAARQLSQATFARLTGAGRHSVYQWASGKRAVPFWVPSWLRLLDFYVSTTGRDVTKL